MTWILLFLVPMAASANLPSSFGPSWIVDRHTQPVHIPARQGSVDIWQLRRASGTGVAVSLVLAYFRPERHRAAIEHVDRSGATRTVYSAGFCPGAIAVANGNFFLDDANKKRPLGLLKVAGKTIVKTSPRKTGGFLAIDGAGKVKVLPKRRAAEAERERDVLESTPVLIWDGRDDMRGDQRDRFDRLAVGNSREGGTIIIGAFATDQQTVSLAEFAKLALAALANKGIRVDSMLAMDGGPSAHLWFPSANVLYGQRGPVYLPSAICVTPK